MTNITLSAAKPPLSNAERRARHYAKDPARALATKRKYRHDNSKWETDTSYLTRGFTAWDGEGVTIDDEHFYVLMAGKSTDGDSVSIADPRGLPSEAIFECLLEYGHRDDIHVIYGGGYDYNMFLSDVPRSVVDRLYHKGTALWNGYRLGWRPGKAFTVARVVRGKRVGKTVQVYDVVSFFQCPFVKACDSYLGDWHEREMIVANKALRSSFDAKDLPDIARYNDAELTNLLALVVELRARLNKCGLRPQRWDGPGAVAAALMKREAVQQYKGGVPVAVASAARFAYAGGRFEVLRFGHVESEVYEYDINSAYPSALRDVPDLSAGAWTHHVNDPGRRPFALYHVEYHGKRAELPGALFRRDANGTVCFPMHLTGWYWSPEVEVARAYCGRGYGAMTVLEAWTFEPATDRKPFAFIEPLYNKRRALKKAGDGAHVGIKLALNSLYGKLAQQVGWRVNDDGTLRLPPFHQLEWAGYTTSWCRANVLRACIDSLESVIAFETDAVFTSEPLPVTLGSGLGDFELTVFPDMTYVQSGTYFAGDVVKTRGVDRCSCNNAPCTCGSLTRALVLEKLKEPRIENRKAEAHLTRFVGAGVALAQSWERWRRWERVNKRITLEPLGKRTHMGCSCITSGQPGIAFGMWHRTVCPMFTHSHSAEFPIEWINPDPAMSELEELRRVPNDYE
jgi:hypothetical protein